MRVYAALAAEERAIIRHNHVTLRHSRITYKASQTSNRLRLSSQLTFNIDLVSFVTSRCMRYSVHLHRLNDNG